jgi:hypothetical protein
MIIADLLVSQPVLQRLTERKMPAKLAYAFAKNIKQVKSELETFDETRLKMLSDNWALDEKTNKYNIPDEDQARWQGMYDELIHGEVKLDPYLIDRNMLDAIEMTPGEILAISWMIADYD